MKKKSIIIGSSLLAAILIACVAVYCVKKKGEEKFPETEELVEEPNTRYGIVLGDHYIEEGSIGNGELVGKILLRYGISPGMIDSLVHCCEGVFDLRSMRAGHNYYAFLTPDSANRRLDHFVYEKNPIDYVVFSFADSVSVRTDSRSVRVERRLAEATIESSLWNAMVGNGYSPSLASRLEEIYAWSVNFFNLKKGDHFKLIYDEQYVDTLSIGYGRIWGAMFEHDGKRYNAIPFDQNGKLEYWDEQGNSLRKNILKSPVSYSRITSRFSNSRLHPVLKIYRAHHGVDYAAPVGTPVQAVADGTITRSSYDGGGGNTVRIKHANGLETSYMHLSRYGAGVRVGKSVSQGDVIGYVGSTGLSTGPHLDYRVYQNGKAIDPLKIPTNPAEPISAVNRDNFEAVKTAVLAALNGTLSPDSIRIN